MLSVALSMKRNRCCYIGYHLALRRAESGRSLVSAWRNRDLLHYCVAATLESTAYLS